MRSEALKTEEEEKEHSITDNRRVVVEDLVYIDDLETVIFTTIAPKSSTVWATSTRKSVIKKEQTPYGQLK